MTDALALVDYALTTGEGEANGLCVPEVHRLRGLFLKSLGSPAEEVESAFRAARQIAEEQGAFLLKLRAAISLARLWRDQGKQRRRPTTSRSGLRLVHRGFDTRDLKEARALLDELAIMSVSAAQQIADWLEKLGLGQYAQRFAENDIRFSVLPDLTDQHLKEIGVSAWASTPTLRAIAELANAGNVQEAA